MTPFSPEPQSPDINNQQTPSTLLLQQHDMNPTMQQQMQQVHQKEAEQLQQFPQASQHAEPQKQTLQQAHAEAQQHFQHAHPVMESPVLSPATVPAGTGIYSMVSNTPSIIPEKVYTNDLEVAFCYQCQSLKHWTGVQSSTSTPLCRSPMKQLQGQRCKTKICSVVCTFPVQKMLIVSALQALSW